MKSPIGGSGDLPILKTEPGVFTNGLLLSQAASRPRATAVRARLDAKQG